MGERIRLNRDKSRKMTMQHIRAWFSCFEVTWLVRFAKKLGGHQALSSALEDGLDGNYNSLK